VATEAPEKPRKAPRQARARLTVDAILMAAAHILRTEGPERMTTNRIARKAGVSIGSLYQYFPNKEAIVAVLRDRHSHYFDERVRDEIESRTGASLRESAAGALRRLIELHVLDGPLHGRLAIDPRVLDVDDEGELVRRLQAFLDGHRGELREVPDTELTAFIVVRAMEAMIHGVAIEDPERLKNPHYATELTELLVRYLSP